MASSDRTVAALTTLAGVLRASTDEMASLVDRAESLAHDLRREVPLAEALAAETRPLVITRLTGLTDRLQAAGTEVRRAEAHQLREEGYTHEQIAVEFGVSRQRVGALLKPLPDKARKPFRPKFQT